MDVTEWIDSYQQSCHLVQGRIAQLNSEIGSHREVKQLRELLDRRYLLYSELWDMQWAIRCLREYLPRDSEHAL